MTKSISEADLYSWNDPDELLRALGEIQDHQKAELIEAVGQLIDHSDEDIREEAMRRLFVVWKDPLRREHVVEALSADESSGVRAVAAYALAATAIDETKERDVHALIQALKNDDEDPAVRAAAYDALLILHRNREFPTRRRTFDPKSDVDWSWVRSLVR